MKNRVLGILVTGLIMASLVGCGAKTEATEQVAESSEVVEADNVDETENVSSEENASDSVGAEDDSIVLYAERGHQDYIPLDETEYEAHIGTISATEDIPLYDGKGYSVGYIKNGSTVSVTEYGTNAWARFENPIDEAGYDYLYVKKEYATDSDLITITTADAETVIKEELANRAFDAPVFVSVADDMEMYEFRIPSIYKSELTGPNYEVDRYLRQRSDNISEEEESIYFYKTYAVVCTEDTDGYIICQVYYKDVITDEEWDAYGK